MAAAALGRQPRAPLILQTDSTVAHTGLLVSVQFEGAKFSRAAPKSSCSGQVKVTVKTNDQRIKILVIFRVLQSQIERMTMEPRDHGGPIIKFWEESGTLDKLEQAIITPITPKMILTNRFLFDSLLSILTRR